MGILKFWSDALAYILAFYLLFNEHFYCKAYNYCSSKAVETELCGKEKHIMCHDNLLPKQDNLETIIPMTKKVRKLILDKHNEYRNMIAGGTISNTKSEIYPKAARMREMLWDYELAYIAEYHASQCSFKHDKCRNSKRFKYSGQNLGRGSVSKNISMKKIINVLDAMYNEKNLVNNTVEFPKKYSSEASAAGHFSVMVNDRSSFLGCGIALCSQPNENKISNYMLTCNYEFTNMVGSLIYMVDDSEAASKCSDWETVKSKQFENLCKNNGKIYPST